MKLVTYDGGFGRIEGAVVVPMGSDLLDYLRSGDALDQEPIELSALRLRAPIQRPGKVVCVGLNYQDHAAESGMDVPPEPPIFGKYSNSVIGPNEAIQIPPAAAKVDYEAELGVVVGARASRVSVNEALEHVAGYTCVNDVSARDLQFANAQWMRGKAIDTFLPTGPYIVTPDEVPDPQALSIRCRVNGEIVQDSSTSQMIWSVAELLSFVSQTITLDPGDLVATGTPAGVGMSRKPELYLDEGDEVVIEIEAVGRLSNSVTRCP